MDPSPAFRLLQATRCAQPLATWLPPSVPSPARVVSVHRSVIDIAAPGGLLAVAERAVGGLPDGISVEARDLRALGVEVGMRVEVTASAWTIPKARLRIDLHGAARWSPAIPVASAAAWPARRSVVADLLAAPDPRGALAITLTERVATDARAAMAGALLYADRTAAAEAARWLIGLGAGLTPSGDDAIAGVEAVLHAVGHPLAGFSDAALEDVDARTTGVSAAMLRHAARGAFAERIHDLVRAVLMDAPGPGGAAIARAAGWGATSGLDTLRGVALALEAVAAEGAHPAIRRRVA